MNGQINGHQVTDMANPQGFVLARDRYVKCLHCDAAWFFDRLVSQWIPQNQLCREACRGVSERSVEMAP